LVRKLKSNLSDIFIEFYLVLHLIYFFQLFYSPKSDSVNDFFLPAKLLKKRRTRVTLTRTSEVLDVRMAAELLTVHPIRSMTSSNAGSFPAGKSVENGSPPGMRCCARSRAHRKTIHLPGPSNAVIDMSSPPPLSPTRCGSRSRSKSVGVVACNTDLDWSLPLYSSSSLSTASVVC
jgi:hypothetical protein